jgi:protein gp37
MREFNPNPKVAAAYAGTTLHPDGGELTWSGQINLLPERLDLPLHWDLPRFIFINSMSEMFDASVPEEFIAEEFAVIGLTPWHTYMLLSKCAARMRAVLTSERFRRLYVAAYRRRARQLAASSPKWRERLRGRTVEAPWPLMNLRLGVSAEDQETAERRIPDLLRCRRVAAVLWVSAEPCVGPIGLRNLKARNGALIDALCGDVNDPRDGVTDAAAPGALDWVVCGGESGPGAAPIHPAWARSLRDQCQATRTAYFFKQWGEWGPAPWRVDQLEGESIEEYKARATAVCATHAHTGNWYEQDGETIWHVQQASQPPWSIERTCLLSPHEPIRRWGKHAAGRLLDGREWNEHPPTWGLAA